jgi:cathepsin B
MKVTATATLFAVVAADTCSLYEIADGSCGQSDLDCSYTKYAKAAEKALEDGTCADQGYTTKTGTQTKSYPVIGDIVISTYSKPASEMQKMADHINSLGASWQAAAPARFGDFEDVKMTLGTIMKGQPGYTEDGLDNMSYEGENVDIPTDFDVRTAFPDCAAVSGNIRDQSSCGSCWAFGSTEAFNDRHCIATGDKTKFSVEDTTANCGFLQCFSMGCNGGQPGQAWSWFKSHGVVTGGDFTDTGAGDTCAPYSLAPCAHHVPATDKYPVCPSSEYATPTLKKCSESTYSKAYADDKIKATGSYSLSGVANIQADMVKYGSATAAFTVYADFPTYKSGVYTHQSGSQLGGHAIKLLGWGVEDGKDYWLVANSWNEMWGNGGTFKIARGTNECCIEGQVSAGTAGAAIV